MHSPIPSRDFPQRLPAAMTLNLAGLLWTSICPGCNEGNTIFCCGVDDFFILILLVRPCEDYGSNAHRPPACAGNFKTGAAEMFGVASLQEPARTCSVSMLCRREDQR